LGKVRECIHDSIHHHFGLTNFKSILHTIDLFHKKLLERGEDGIAGIKKDLDYPVKKIISYLNEEGTEDQKQAEINLDYLSRQVDIMEKMALEMDEKYKKRV
ncbi:hypothetical protein MYX76_16600, partial [Desulfobacterota bacterium AH_259_B03_O07]|nr:hypothetical protein [Desulfobacterota bacterium AH_259_B03_O07]